MTELWRGLVAGGFLLGGLGVAVGWLLARYERQQAEDDGFTAGWESCRTFQRVVNAERQRPGRSTLDLLAEAKGRGGK